MITQRNYLACRGDMNLLAEITARKKQEVAETRKKCPPEALREMPWYTRERVSLVSRLLVPGSSQVIAEIKRASPSRGLLFNDLDVLEVAKGYEDAGVSGISILTDYEGFKGSIDDILQVREHVSCPILRKEFIVDPYQIDEARAIGADVVLIIASALSPEHARDLSRYAKELGMEVLFEVHDVSELESHSNPYADIVGVNNRNLKTLDIDLETSFLLASKIPDGVVRISESGISDPAVIARLRGAGYQGFLIGENFMKTGTPAKACKDFIEKSGAL
jgi:indole-3-glycerol phosphate synthase